MTPRHAKRTFDAFSNPALAEVVALVPHARVVVYGVATDYCVAAACRSLLDLGREVDLVTDAVRGIDGERQKRVLDELAAQGVRFVETADAAADAAG